MIGPWESACRAAWSGENGDFEQSALLAECKRLDRIGTPAIKPKPGYEPRSRFLRAMYGLPAEEK
jgi:hypothetical protein